MPVEERFWAKVDKRGPDECWPWMAWADKSGYGRMGLGGHNSRGVGAHRIAYELAAGPIPEGLSVLHRCDNRICVNLAHLFLGTHQDNMDDMMSKGRHGQTGCKGERHPGAKLTDAVVLQIKDATGLHREIAKDFGVSRSLVSQIKSGGIWKHVNSAAIWEPS